MESRIRLKASRKEMQGLFENNYKGVEGISVKYFEQVKENLYDVVIRHMQLIEPLEGTFTVEEMMNKMVDTLQFISKGDIIKTALSDNTIVLKVESDNALLFTGSQFVVAHGIQKESDGLSSIISWIQGTYYDELPDNMFDRNERNHSDIGEGKNFSYKMFCEYVKNKMSTIYENEEGEHTIFEDTEPLIAIIPDELGYLSEEETLRYIYDNNLFGEMEEIISRSSHYMYGFDNNKDYEDDWDLEP